MQTEEEITSGEKEIIAATPEGIASEIDQARQRVLRRAGALVTSLVEIGELLAEAKDVMDDEPFLDWLENRVGLTQRLAGKYVDLASDREAQRKAVPAALCGTLGLNLFSEVQLPPDGRHMVKARDLSNKVLYLWPVDDRAERLRVFAMDRSPGSAGYWEGMREPVLAAHAAQILADRPPCGFTFLNAHYEILPAGPKDLARLDDMLARYVAKSDANGERAEEGA